MSNRTTFRLPGHNLNHIAERKILLSLLAAYSKQWNPRNLEYPWYEPWGQILGALVTEHPALSVAPQPYLWYDALSLPSKAHPTPGSRRLLTTKEQLEGLLEKDSDIGNTTLDSICSISIPSHRDRARIPDFAITHKISSPRETNTRDLLQLLAHRVTYVGFPLLAELKASGHRSGDIKASLLNAKPPMVLAQESLMKQAIHLFKIYPRQNSVLLIAITGFWWSYCIHYRVQAEAGRTKRDEDKGRNGDGDEDEDEDELHEGPDLSFPDQDGIHASLPQSPLQMERTSAQALQEQLQAYGFTLSKLKDLPDAVRFHTVMEEGELALREDGGWSHYS